MAVCLYAAAAALIKGPRAVTVIVVFLGGLSLLSFGGSLGPLPLTAGIAFAAVFSLSVASRYLFFLSAAAVLIEGAIEGMVPLTAAVLAASPVKNDKWRAIILAGGLSAVLIISGLPSTKACRSLVLQEALSEEGVVWKEPAELNLGMPELLLQAPGIDVACMTLRVSAGGVRDTSPVGYVTSADRTFPVYPGENTLIIEEPEFPVSIRISRSWKPFYHPVVHFHFAEGLL
ncbi:MAG: hypothetical protein GQ565_04265 [Candidatus Aegiribacteria sp.]|nr:hypothetical protein [Candidatus Aegiribacteria sp.]